ncbi:MAG: hypothetical protein NVSMB19_15590 [Vulcanimicrobiaceae bacterium]
MEHEPSIAPDTLKPVEPHGDVSDAQLADVRVDGPDVDASSPISPDPNVEIEED